MDKSSQKGFAIVEVIVVLGLITFLVISVGKLMDSAGKMEKNSELQSRALLHVQESLEIVNANKNIFFACRCTSDNCSGSTCTVSDGQACGLFKDYTSCWTAYPRGLAGKNDFYLEKSGTDWLLKGLDGGSEIIDNQYSRKITVENVLRDPNGLIASAGTPDSNTKKITVTVWYKERENMRSISLSTILTAWENL